MTEKTKKGREAPISYRPPAELREAFRARVEKSGLSTNAFITKAVFGGDAPRQSRRPAIEEKLLARLLAEAAAIRGQLHEITLTGAQDRDTILLEMAASDLAEIRAALLLAMGRKP